MKDNNYLVVKFEKNYDPEVIFRTDNEVDALSVCNAFNKAMFGIRYLVYAEYEVQHGTDDH